MPNGGHAIWKGQAVELLHVLRLQVNEGVAHGYIPAPSRPEPIGPRVDGRVIVIGAGPAGLAAALHLKVCRV
jgi:NADPH-dependent glutamate synthase beta subunit-like oxidoreductase